MDENKLSIIIPSRNEKYLKQTIQDLLKKAVQEIEIIVVLDGYWPLPDDFINDSRVSYIHLTKPLGMRAAINKGVAIARGKYILKTDAHCMFDKGFDLYLKTDCADNMVVIPRRFRLDPDKWEVIEDGRPGVDYMFLAYPDDASVWGGSSLQGKEWREKNLDENLKLELISDLMTAQGSCWFMMREYYYYLELMDEENYGEFGKEMQEIGLKCQLSGGRMVRNKKTWYAHWHKPRSHGRGYSLSGSEFKKASDYTRKWFEIDKVWHRQTKNFDWLINKFWPIPTWPENWGDKNDRK